MRLSEAIELGYFLLMLALLWLRPPSPARRRDALWLAGIGLAAVLAGWLLAPLLPGQAGPIVRDWLPAPLIPVAYWLAGRFFEGPDERFQQLLLGLDRRLLGWLLEPASFDPLRRLLALYSELSYLFCYPLPPLALAALYLEGQRQACDGFWTLVLPPTYACYLMLPFLPSLPPRSLGGVRTPPSGQTRRLNLWILRHLSIGANTFPSAHVATSIAIALTLLQLTPPLGLLTLLVALSIAVATVVGRYHYLADAVLGTAVALGWFAVARGVLG